MDDGWKAESRCSPRSGCGGMSALGISTTSWYRMWIMMAFIIGWILSQRFSEWYIQPKQRMNRHIKMVESNRLYWLEKYGTDTEHLRTTKHEAFEKIREVSE